LQHIDFEAFINEKYQWQLSGYERCTHKRSLTGLHMRHKSQQNVSCEAECSATCPLSIETPLARSHGAQLKNTSCFFCDKIGSRRDSLHVVPTHAVVKKNYEAVKISDSAAWKLKLSGCIVATDAHAHDISYHNACYTKHVNSVLRR
jgi:hypothetical protein